MSSRKKTGMPYREELHIHTLKCPINVKESVMNYFTDMKGYNKKTTPIIVRGVRLFSIYQFSKPYSNATMLALTKYGAQFIDKNCGDLIDSEEVYLALKKFFIRQYKDDKELLSVLIQLLRVLSIHYIETHFSENSVYFPGQLDKSYLCVFFPVPVEDIKGMKVVLSKQFPELNRELLYREYSL